MFKLITTGAKISSVTNRAEKHGKELVSAQTLRLSCITSALHLDELDGSGNLRKSLFKKPSNKRKPSSEEDQQTEMALEDNGELVEVKLKNVPSIQFKDKLPGYTMLMGSGLTATSPVEQDACTLSDFVITPKDGGTVQLEFNVGFQVDEEHAGFFACQVQRLMNITLLPPGHEEEEAQPELEAEA